MSKGEILSSSVSSVHFCVCVSKSLRKWTQTDTKVTFHPPPPPPPPENFFWSQMKGMAKIRLFYSSAMELIFPWLKDIINFVLKLIYTHHFNPFICLSLCLWMSQVFVAKVYPYNHILGEYLLFWLRCLTLLPSCFLRFVLVT